MVQISPSILSADFTKLGEEIHRVEAAGADLIHIDVMDGHFVPNLTVGPFIVEAARKITRLPLDVHLMIEKPERYLRDFAEAGSDIITVHLEACTHLHRVIQTIREMGKRAGLSLNPATPLVLLEPMLQEIDLLLIMSVNPGFSGQKFIQGTLEKVRAARQMIRQAEARVEIEVDGGVTVNNAGDLVASGADILVSGSAVFGSRDYKETISKMKEVPKK